MFYSILSGAGNLVDAFENESAAIAAYRALVESDPEYRDELQLLAQDDDGNFVDSPAINAALADGA